MFRFPDHTFEFLPVLQTTKLLVFVEITLTVFIPPYIGVFGDIDHLGVFELDVLNIYGQHLNDILYSFDAVNRECIQPLDEIYKFLKKMIFFIAIFDKELFFS